MNNFFLYSWLSLFLKFNIVFVISLNLFLFLLFLVVTYNNYFLRNKFIFKLNSFLKILSVLAIITFFFSNSIFFFFSIFLNVNKAITFNCNDLYFLNNCLNFNLLSYNFTFNYYGFVIYLLALLVGFLSILSLDTRVILEKTNFFFFF